MLRKSSRETGPTRRRATFSPRNATVSFVSGVSVMSARFFSAGAITNGTPEMVTGPGFRAQYAVQGCVVCGQNPVIPARECAVERRAERHRDETLTRLRPSVATSPVKTSGTVSSSSSRSSARRGASLSERIPILICCRMKPSGRGLTSVWVRPSFIAILASKSTTSFSAFRSLTP